MKKISIFPFFLCVLFFLSLYSMGSQDVENFNIETPDPSLKSYMSWLKTFPGLIHPSLVESVEIGFQYPLEQQLHLKALSTVENQKKSASDSDAGSDPISSLFIKFGWMFSERDVYDNWWIAGLGFDIVLLRVFSIGMETLPTYKSYTDLLATHKRFSLFGFGNLKLKLNLKGLAEDLRMLNVIGGGGAGLRFVNTHSKSENKDTSEKESDLNFAYHFILGIELNLKVLSLLIEYQPVATVYESIVWISPKKFRRNYYGDWSHYFMVGIRI